MALQYYRLERVFSGAIMVKEGEAQYIKSPSDVGTGKAKDEKAPLSEIIEVLNARFGTQFSEEDRLFFQQIKEKACKSEQIVRTAMANPLDKFELGIRKLIEDLMIERMGENDKIVALPKLGKGPLPNADIRAASAGRRYQLARSRATQPASRLAN